MRTLARGLWNLVICLSLLACLAACSMWVRSRSVCDVVRRTEQTGADTAFCSADGFLQFSRTSGTSQLMMYPFTNSAMPYPLMVTKVPTPWQWLRSPPSQAPSSLLQPAPGDAAVDARAVVLLARSSAVYSPGSYSGFSSGLVPPASAETTVSIASPYWFLAAITGALPLMRFAGWCVRRRRSRLARRGACGNCGYDLRATPEGGGPLLDRCPECGKVPSLVSSSKRSPTEPSSAIT